MPGTKVLKPLACALCGALARHYYLGDRCPQHAPTEAQVRENAARRYRARTRLEASA